MLAALFRTKRKRLNLTHIQSNSLRSLFRRLLTSDGWTRTIMISFFDCFFVGALALTALYFYLKKNFNFWKKKGIAGDEKPSILFGSLTDAILGRRQLGEVYTDLYRKFPGEKVVGWFKFRTPALLLRDPDIIRKVLVNDFHSFRNNDVSLDADIDPIMGSNIFVLKDELWKKRRALITPAFTAVKIRAVYPVMEEVAKSLVEYLKKHPEELHVKNTMSRYTSEIVARCAFGIEGNNLKDQKPEMHELGKLIFEPTMYKNLKFLSFLTMPTITRLFRIKLVPDKVINFFDKVLRDVIVYRQENNVESNDLLQYFIDVKRKSLEVAKGTVESEIITKVYSDDDVLSGCIMFFVEGFETTANIINNVLYNLALNKDVQETLRREIDETLSEGELTFEKLHAMNYLHCVYAESNRILPAAYSSQKVCTERYEMDIGKDKPLVIEKGTPIVIPVYGIHTDPVFWTDAEKFNPERFAGKEETNAKNKGIYMPFSDGPRVCPGSRIATTMAKIALVNILSHLEVLPTSKTPKTIEADPNYFMIAHKGGIYLRFVERSR